MDNDNSRNAAMLRHMAIMLKRLDDERGSLDLCGEFNCIDLGCENCIFDNGPMSVRELNGIADILDGKDV